ncbi:hypothetical protein BKA80DRAFT_117931 [Phyllosticta citrichinensis]
MRSVFVCSCLHHVKDDWALLQRDGPCAPATFSVLTDGLQFESIATLWQAQKASWYSSEQSQQRCRVQVGRKGFGASPSDIPTAQRVHMVLFDVAIAERGCLTQHVGYHWNCRTWIKTCDMTDAEIDSSSSSLISIPPRASLALCAWPRMCRTSIQPLGP